MLLTCDARVGSKILTKFALNNALNLSLKFFLPLRRGNEFLKPLIILDQSILRGGENAKKISDYVANGENVVILSNHQTEADPQVS